MLYMLNLWRTPAFQEIKEALLGSPCGVENSGKSCRNQLSVRRGHREDVLEMGYKGKVMKEGMYTVCFRELR